MRAAVVVTIVLAPGARAAAAADAPDDRRFHQYAVQHWSLEEGLPQVGVADLAQDSRGFLWVATQDGLARFDGVEFRVFDTANTPELAGDNIVRLLFDASGVLWIATRTGLSRFDGHAFQQVRAGADGLGPVATLAAASGGVLVASDKGVFLAQGTTATKVENTPIPRATLAVPLEPGGMLVGGSGRLVRTTSTRSREYSLASFGEGVVPKRYVDGCGARWIASTVGLLVLDDSTVSRFEPLGPRNVDALHCDAGGTLWVGTGNGLYRVRDRRIVEVVDDESVLPHLFVSAFLPGRDGGLWMGTLTGGLYRLAVPRYTRFNKYEGLPFSSTWAVAEARDGGLWIGGADGVARLDGDRFTAVGRPESLPERVVTTLVEDAGGRLWVGTRSGLTILDPRTGRATKVLDAFVLALAEAPDGAMWIGAVSGLYSSRDGVLRKEGADQGIARVRALRFAPRAGLLVGTEQGAFVEHDGRFERIDQAATSEPRRVGAVFEDRRGDVWVGYLGAGLARRSAASGEWTHYDEREGLLSDTVYAVASGDDGRVWLSTQKGVLALDPAMPGHRPGLARENGPGAATPALDVVVSITGREPGSSAGYCCNGGTSGAATLRADGSFWLATLDGVLRVDTHAGPVSRPSPRPYVLALRRSGGVETLATGQETALRANERDVEFVFTAPVFDKPSLTRFRYRLDGYDNEWKDARGRRSASYTNLGPGRYRFRVQVETADGLTGRTDAAWAFSIAPRFTETWWFYGLLAPLVVAALYLAFALRVRHLRLHSLRLEQIVAERTKQLEVANEELSSANGRLERMSYTDPLTGLWNRRYLTDHVEHDLAQLRRLRLGPSTAHHRVVFLLVDLDHFKAINDRWGHDAGDRVLAETASRLLDVVRRTDYVVRWGGEEFLVVACFSTAEMASLIAHRVHEAVGASPYSLADGTSLHVTASVGFAVLPFGRAESPDSPDWGARGWQASVALADRMLYLVKADGRDSWAGVVPADVPPELPVVDVVRDFDALLARGDLSVVRAQQPDLHDTRIAS